MNNIQQKNIIYGLNDKSSMPYRKSGHVLFNNDDSHFSTNNINFQNINNAFQQLLDNDLYNENYLNNRTSQDGPKGKDDVASDADGTKYWGDANNDDIEILRKRQLDLKDTVEVLMLGKDVNFSVEHDGVVYVGCDDGLYYATDFVNPEFQQITTLGSYGFTQCDGELFVGMSDGVYRIYVHGDDESGSEKVFREPVKLNKETLAGVRAILIRKEDEKIFVGTSSGIYEGYFPSNINDVLEESIDFEKDEFVDDSGNIGDVSVNGIYSIYGDSGHEEIPLENSVVVTSDSGLFVSNYGMTAKDRMVLLSGTRIYDHAYFNGRVYFATADGLKYLYNDKIVDSSPVVFSKLVCTGSRMLAISQDGTSIYEIYGSGMDQICSGTGIVDAVPYEEIVIYATRSGLNCLYGSGSSTMFYSCYGTNFIKLAADEYLYVGTTSGLHVLTLQGIRNTTTDTISGLLEYKIDGLYSIGECIVKMTSDLVVTQNTIYKHEYGGFVKKVYVPSGDGGTNTINDVSEVAFRLDTPDGSSAIRYVVCTSESGVFLYDDDFSNTGSSGTQLLQDSGRSCRCAAMCNDVLAVQLDNNSSETRNTIKYIYVGNVTGRTFKDVEADFRDFVRYDGGSYGDICVFGRKDDGSCHLLTVDPVSVESEDIDVDPTGLVPTQIDVDSERILRYDGKYYIATHNVGNDMGNTTTNVVDNPYDAVVSIGGSDVEVSEGDFVEYEGKKYIFGDSDDGSHMWMEYRQYSYEEYEHKDFTLKVSDSPLYFGVLQHIDETGIVLRKDGIYERLDDAKPSFGMDGILYVLYTGDRYYVFTEDMVYQLSTDFLTANGIGLEGFGNVRTARRFGSDGTFVSLADEDRLYKVVNSSVTSVKYIDQRTRMPGNNIKRVFPHGERAEDVVVVLGDDSHVDVLEYDHSEDSFEKVEYRMTVGGVTSPIDVQDVFYINDDADQNYVILKDGICYQAINGSRRRFSRSDYYSGLLRIDEFDGYTYICTSGQETQCLASENGFVFGLVGHGSARTNKMVWFDNLRYVVSTSSGLCYFVPEDGGKMFKAKASDDESIIALTGYRFDGESQKFVFGRKTGVCSTDNLRKEEILMSIGGSVAKDILVVDRYTFFVSTQNGLYHTKSTYELVNDIKKFTQDDARQLYDDMSDELDDYSGECMENHMLELHGEDSVATYVCNSCMDVSLSSLADFTQDNFAAGGGVENDLVKEIVFGDQSDGDVRCVINNNQTNNKDELVSCTYVVKKYNSGLTEVDVYVPTTMTYYIGHVDGTPSCGVDPNTKTHRKNLDNVQNINTYVNSRVDQNSTKVRLGICKPLFTIDGVLEVNITGNSLPLKIYKDDQYSGGEGTSSELYHSTIQPSIMTGMTANNGVDSDGFYNFDFRCFGQDAQAIRLQFHDPKNIKTTETFRVKFNSYGGSGEMPYQRFVIGQKQSLRRNRFTKDMCVFAGWSVGSPKEDNSDPDFNDGFSFGSEYMEKLGKRVGPGGVVNLYAVWIRYTLSGGETEFVVQDDGSKFVIDRVRINTGTNIEDNLMVDFK